MAESIVKTFKRDYASVQDLWIPESVLAMIPKWFDDNKNHSHKDLKMMSPQQLCCAQASYKSVRFDRGNSKHVLGFVVERSIHPLLEQWKANSVKVGNSTRFPSSEAKTFRIASLAPSMFPVPSVT